MMIRGEHDSPRYVLQSSSDVIRLEVRVVGQDLLVIAATCDQSDDHPDGDTEATKARLAPHDVGVKCDPIDGVHDPSPAFAGQVANENLVGCSVGEALSTSIVQQPDRSSQVLAIQRKKPRRSASAFCHNPRSGLSSLRRFK